MCSEWSKQVKLVVVHRGDSRRGNLQKGFDTHDCMKIEAPDNVFGVVKTAQTRGSSQGGAQGGEACIKDLTHTIA